ncbi:MAG: agmatinase [Elusimicrobia bacterium]|nr:agmatinase [Elusimicrobiota bacterium]
MKTKKLSYVPVLGQKQNFLGLPFPHCDLDKAKFAVVPVAFERTTSYIKGTVHGPSKLLAASHQLEFYDEELSEEIGFSHGIATIKPLKPTPRVESKEFLLKTSSVVRELAQRGKFVATVGGEHTITFAPVNAMKDVYPDLSILYIDAHADLRDSYEGTPWNHACALRRSIEACHSAGGRGVTALVGIRSMDVTEARYIQDNRTLALFDAHRCRRLATEINRIIEHLGEHVYISIDLDGLDPSVIPGVGTPQPGGLGWYDLLDLLKAVFDHRKVVGVDLMELAPLKGQVVSEFAAAKLLYRVFGYAARGRPLATK